jgi:hypothetical protein
MDIIEEEAFRKVKTFNELYALIKKNIRDIDWVGYGQYANATRQAVVKIRRSVLADAVQSNSPLNLPPVPQSGDPYVLMDYCTDASIAIEKAKIPVVLPTVAPVKRKTKVEKTALIIDVLKSNPNAKSAEIELLTGIDESNVRKLWKGPKERMKAGKVCRGQNKTDIQDPSASCSICNDPLSGPFECEICKKIISGECKTCHYTNEHPEDAIP